PRRLGEGVRRDPRHQPAGARAPARDPGAPRRYLPRRRRDRRGRVAPHARVHREYGTGGRARGLQGAGERRPDGRPDGLPPPLARPRPQARPRGPVARPDRGERAVTLISRIEDDVKEATLARDAERRDALRLILASLRSAEKDLQRPLSDDEELQVLQRERKRRIEAAEAFHAAGRDEQAAKEESELAILEEFMPAPLTEEELERIVDDAIAENGATSIRDMGRVMADVMPQIHGGADGGAG